MEGGTPLDLALGYAGRCTTELQTPDLPKPKELIELAQFPLL